MVEIRLNNEWFDITNEVLGTITYDFRVDEVLDSGTFTFVSKTIDYNIPPLTLCNIDGEYWLCSSECNEVIPSNPKEYNHNVTLIELTYYLQCYIVGTKSMSNTGTMYPTNKDKCEALVDFINNKYSLIFGDKANQFKFDTNAFNDSRWKLEREFMFGSGTTLFQSLLEIGKTCNAIPRITTIDEEIYGATYDYKCTVTCSSKENDLKTITLNYNRIDEINLEDVYNQYKNQTLSIGDEINFKISFENISPKPNSYYVMFKAENIDLIEYHYYVGYSKREKNKDGLFRDIMSGDLYYLLITVKSSSIESAMPKLIYLYDSTSLIINWDLLDSNNEFTLDENKILTKQMFQNVDQYTAILESEVNDVVDRTNDVMIYGVTARSNSTVIYDDNQLLKLPFRIESVDYFELDLSKSSPTGRNYIPNFYLKNSAIISYESGDFSINDSRWNNIIYSDVLTWIRNIANKLDIGDKSFHLSSVVSSVSHEYGYYDYVLSVTGTMLTDGENEESLTVNITNYILEKTQYDLLNAQDKTKYCYYTYNDNTIEGIYTFFGEDLWSTIFGQSRYPFLYYVFNDYNQDGFTDVRDKVVDKYLDECAFVKFYNNFDVQNGLSYNPRDYVFNLRCKPITSLFLLSSKDKEAFNEDEIKPTSRSFELSSSMSDFDLLVKSIDKNNKMMGLPEVSISYYGNNYPKPMNSITIKNQTYYVSSVQTTIVLGKYTSVINLVKEYNKIAEVFGVKTQFESTRLPLNNIVNRIVYCGEISNNDNITGLYLDDYKLFKFGAIYVYENFKYLVIEAQDNYSFDTSSSNNDTLTSGYKENKQLPYSNEYNEQITYKMSLANLNKSITKEQCENLPNVDENMIDIISTTFVKIYKDAREKIIFIFKLV